MMVPAMQPTAQPAAVKDFYTHDPSLAMALEGAQPVHLNTEVLPSVLPQQSSTLLAAVQQQQQQKQASQATELKAQPPPQPPHAKKSTGKTVSTSTKAAKEACEEQNETNIYISGLPKSITDEAFRELVSVYGQIFSHKVVHKPDHSPIGFVQYTTPGAMCFCSFV